MASFQKLADGQVRASLYVKGKRDSKTCRNMREAKGWAITREAELQALAAGRGGEIKGVHEALDQYAREVSPTKRGARWELVRIEAIKKQIQNEKLSAPGLPKILADWKRKRDKAVKPGTVLREMGLLSAVFETARRDWKWITVNPLADIRKPTKPKHRARLIRWGEIKRTLRALDHHPRRPVLTITQATALTFCVELRTGMRSGEICGIEPDEVKVDQVNLPETKNGEPRDVPLSVKARLLFKRAETLGTDTLFAVGTNTRDTLFRQAKKKAKVAGFTFHDGRHTAATMMAKRFIREGKTSAEAILDMCKVFGWKDPRMALVYFNPDISDLAARL